MKKILIFGMSDKIGGVENVIMNYYRNIDKDKMQFDFVAHTDNMSYREEIEANGSKVYVLPSRRESISKYKKEMKEFYKTHSHEYCAIWNHGCSLSNIDHLKLAQKYGIKTRIAHAHQSKNMGSFVTGILHKLHKLSIGRVATKFWSCGILASKYFYSKKIIEGQDHEIISNAIDTRRFKFDEKIRKDYRREMKLNKSIVVGHVGQFREEKNHDFIIDVFNELYKKDNKYKLLLVGDGVERKKIEEKVKTLNLEECVMFLGARKDVNQLLQAMDIFLFPSKFEGLPLTLVEAQTAGLPVVTSENVTSEIKILDSFERVSLEMSAQEWSEKISAKDTNIDNREDAYQNVINRGYDISQQVKHLEEVLI